MLQFDLHVEDRTCIDCTYFIFLWTMKDPFAENFLMLKQVYMLDDLIRTLRLHDKHHIDNMEENAKKKKTVCPRHFI